MMVKTYIWLKLAIFFQLFTAAIHSYSFLFAPTASKETQLGILIDAFGSAHNNSLFTASAILIAMSACFTLLFVFGGILNWYLISAKAEARLIRGILQINLVIYTICFVLMIFFTLLPPLVCTGLILVFLLLGRLNCPVGTILYKL